MSRLCRQSEDRAQGAGETTRRRPRICATCCRERVSRAHLQRPRWRNEQGFPRTVSGENNTACDGTNEWISTAATAARPLGRQRWFVAEQIFWRLAQIEGRLRGASCLDWFNNALTRGQFNDHRNDCDIDRLVVGYPLGCNFIPRAVPNFGFCSLQAATSCGSICGKGLVACFRCGVPCMVGRMQSDTMPTPILAPRTAKPACLHAAAICAQARPPFAAD